MVIHFYLNNSEETQITSMYDLASNPFKIGDEISLDVEELYPSDYNKFTDNHRIKMLKDNNELTEKFKHKKVKLVRENKYVDFNIVKEAKLTIEYHCVYLKD